jgi:hypothetical protein
MSINPFKILSPFESTRSISQDNYILLVVLIIDGVVVAGKNKQSKWKKPCSFAFWYGFDHYFNG